MAIILNEELYNLSALPELLKAKQSLGISFGIAEKLSDCIKNLNVSDAPINSILDGIDELESNIHSLGVYIDNSMQKVISLSNSFPDLFDSESDSKNGIITATKTALLNYIERLLIIRFSKNNFDFFGESVSRKSDEEIIVEYEKIRERYFNTDKFDNYPYFKDLLLQDRFLGKTCRDTEFATQGCCEVGNTVFITSYDTGYNSDGSIHTKENSRLDVKDYFGREKTLFFDNDSHVGGISYCDWNNKLYVCGEESKVVNCYDVGQISSLQNGDKLVKSSQKSLAEEDKIEKASYLTTHDKNLFVGQFDEAEDTALTKYSLAQDGSIGEIETIYNVPYHDVQGLCITEYEGEEYFIFSSSCGRKNDSRLIVSQVNENNEFETCALLKMPCLSEQVSLDQDGNIMVVFESDCIKYGDGVDGEGKSTSQVGNVCYLDKDKLLGEYVDNFNENFEWSML